MHASVGSGHKAAANAIAQAFDLIRGTKGIPEDIEIEVRDILDFGRIRFDGNKTAASFTGATRPIYDLTGDIRLQDICSGAARSMVTNYVPRLQRIRPTRRPIAVVATHITAANVAVGARASSRVSITRSSACRPITKSKAFGPTRDTDLFCVANEFMAETLSPP